MNREEYVNVNVRRGKEVKWRDIFLTTNRFLFEFLYSNRGRKVVDVERKVGK